MTLTIEVPAAEEAAWKEEAERLGMTLEELPPQAVMAKLSDDLKNRAIPQSLDEIKPRRVPPPDKTVWDMVVGQWPGDETDEEINKALEEMS